MKAKSKAESGKTGPRSGAGKRETQIPTTQPVLSPDEFWGKIAYEAYAKARLWKSAGGGPLPVWDKMRTAIKVGWMKSAREVIRRFQEALMNDGYETEGTQGTDGDGRGRG